MDKALMIKRADAEERKGMYIAGGITAGVVLILAFIFVFWVAFRGPIPPPGQKEYLALGAIDFGNEVQGSQKVNNFEEPSPTPADNPKPQTDPVTQPDPTPQTSPPDPVITSDQPSEVTAPPSDVKVDNPSETPSNNTNNNPEPQEENNEPLDAFEFGGSNHGQNGNVGNSGSPNTTVLNDDVYTWGAGGGNGLVNRGLVRKVDPVYISGVQEEGTVVFTITISPNGSVKRVTAQTPYLKLKEMGIKAIRKWRFDPIEPSRGDQKVNVGIKFQLK